MAQTASLQDFRGEGPPGDIGIWQLPCSYLVFNFVFSGVTYTVALNGQTGKPDYIGTGFVAVLTLAMGPGGRYIQLASNTTFTCEITPVPTPNNTHIKGGGYTTILLMNTTIANYHGQFENLHARSATVDYNIELEGFKIDGQHATQANNNPEAIYCEGVNNLWVHHIWFTGQRGNCVECQVVTGVSLAGCRGIYVNDCICDYAEYNFIEMASSLATYELVDIVITRNNISNCDTGISIEGLARRAIISHNTVYQCINTAQWVNGLGIVVEPSGQNYPIDITISTNTVRECRSGIKVLSANSKNISIVGNICENNFHDNTAGYATSYGNEITANGATVLGNILRPSNNNENKALIVGGTWNVIVGNTIDCTLGVAGVGMAVDWQYATYSIFATNYILNPPGYCIAFSGGDYNEFLGNFIYKAGAMYNFPAFRVTLAGNATYNKFEHNTLYNCTTGFNFTAGSNYNIVDENRFLTVTTPISDAGTGNTAHRNKGYVTENMVDAVIAAAATSIVVPHGCAYTPNAAEIHWSLTNLPTTPIGDTYVDTIGAANFTLHCTTVPGVATAIFRCQIIRT